MKLNENINWGKPIKNTHYVVLSELPDEVKDKFEKWLTGKTRPLIESEGDRMFDCAYYSDYEKFLSGYLVSHK